MNTMSRGKAFQYRAAVTANEALYKTVRCDGIWSEKACERVAIEWTSESSKNVSLRYCGPVFLTIKLYKIFGFGVFVIVRSTKFSVLLCSNYVVNCRLLCISFMNVRNC